eukprot:COSAG06_NODE_493_length_15060_cov_50.594546_5_plen_75_part_00
MRIVCVCVFARPQTASAASLALTDWLIDAGTTPLRWQGISRSDNMKTASPCIAVASRETSTLLVHNRHKSQNTQ